MPVVTVGSVKGGVGKTTVATNLAVMLAQKGEDVLLVDADWQENATDFTELRTLNQGDAGYTCIRLSNMQVKAQVRKLREKYATIVIDAGGRDSVSQRAAISISDVLLAPFTPRSFDLWTLEPLLEIIDETLPVNEDLRTLLFLNRGDPFGTDMEEAYAYVEAAIASRTDTVLLREHLGNRKAFAAAASLGLAVTELKPRDAKAEAEMSALFDVFTNHFHVNCQKAHA